ncbi:MAG: hypothetical protein PUC73_11610 [Lachnospiraceae bacterium]|nr:hypothetical protein [Lachnospiraceae bacterium]
MKCKGCGGNYKTRELMCPYCTKPNMLGKLWSIEKSEAEKEYEAAGDTYRKTVSTYVINRFLNRVILICVLLLVLFIGGIIIAGFLEIGVKEARVRLNENELNAKLEQYYEKRELTEMYRLMSEYDMFGTDRYRYSQAALLGREFMEFQLHKLQFMEQTEEEKINNEYCLESLLRSAMKVYGVRVGIYSEPDPDNVDLIEEFRADVMAFLVGTLALTEDEIAAVAEQDFYLSSDAEALAELVRERRGWNE